MIVRAVYIVGCEDIVGNGGKFPQIAFAFLLIEAGVRAVYVHVYSPLYEAALLAPWFLLFCAFGD